MKTIIKLLSITVLTSAIILAGCPSTEELAKDTYGITIKQNGEALASYTFTDHTPLSVTIENTGTVATGALVISLGGANATSFTLSKTTIADIVKDGSGVFTVKPKETLDPGNHSATVTVTGGNNISAGFSVTYEEPAAGAYGISLVYGEEQAVPAKYFFLDDGEGGKLTVRVNNTGNNTTGDLDVALSGIDAASFTLGGLTGEVVPSIAVDADGSFTVSVNEGLSNKKYNATVTVSNTENGIAKFFNITYWAFSKENFYGTFSVTTGNSPYRRIILNDDTFTFQWSGSTGFSPLTLDVESKITDWEKMIWDVENGLPNGFEAVNTAWKITFEVTDVRNYSGAGTAVLPLYGGGPQPGDGSYTAWLICKDPATLSGSGEITIGLINNGGKRATPWGNFIK